jgi:dihydrolipoamide dehydrogenase
MTEHFDIAIIGAGPGGYVAAVLAAQLGFKTVCIDEREEPGGTCLNVGCIPSKALLSSTELLYRLQKDGKNNGIECKEVNVNFSQMMKRKREIVASLNQGVRSLFKNNKVMYKVGKASFIDDHRLQVGSEEISADHIIIATGSEPIALPGMPFDEKQIVSSTGALSLPKTPKRMIVIGGGVIGVELASVYSRLGAQVIVVEMLDHICPAMEPSISNSLLKILQKQGIEFMLSTEVITSVKQPDEVILTIKQGSLLKNLSADVVLVAVGRRPNTAGLKLENSGVYANRKGFIAVDDSFRTAVPHIYAIGDVIEGVMLAHRASAEGTAVVAMIKGGGPSVDYLTIPNVIYTYPEVAAVGMSEKEAKDLGLEVVTGTSYFKGNARSRCTDEMEGFIKVLGDKKSRRVVGISIIGPHASELISEGMIAIQQRATIEDLASAPNAHPTFSETLKEAAESAKSQ